MRRSVEAVCCSVIDTGAMCIVNASNSTATLGGGVSRALFDECGGDVLQTEMRDQLAEQFDGPLEMDDCLVTSGGTSTRIRYVLHVASVDYRGVKARAGVGGAVEHTVSSIERVQRATTAAFRAGGELASKLATMELSIALPLLGAGSGGLSPVASITAMVHGMRSFFREEPLAGVSKIVFAVPEPDRVVVCQRRIEELLVVR
jgi:O-acetyl-ADP-ribose deacetylase (regulator of RNase III)